jgi:hypothetical protein
MIRSQRKTGWTRNRAMAELFSILPEDFFKPLTGKYKKEYAECIMLMFNTFKPEISYGVNREGIVSAFEAYFSSDNVDLVIEDGDEELVLSDAHDKANAVIKALRDSGWIEYDQGENHEIKVILMEYAIPVIESFNKLIRNEETEYQGIISDIYSSLKNSELYGKPYELILKGVNENTERLISELKRLSVSIKRHMDRQTNDMTANEVLEYFFKYEQDIGSKAYLRMKTSENISYYRNDITDMLDAFLDNTVIMDSAVKGYMEIEKETSEEKARETVITMIRDIKSSFYNINDIIADIDLKHSKYIRSAVMRARFLLSSGSNLTGKLEKLLYNEAVMINRDDSLFEAGRMELSQLFQIYPQYYIENGSLRTEPTKRTLSEIGELDRTAVMTEAERKEYSECFRNKNQNRFSRKKIDEYMRAALGDKGRITASSLPRETRRDIIRIIYISIYGNNKANCYHIERNERRFTVGGYSFPDFDIVKS